MERTEVELLDAARAIDVELRKMRNTNLPREERQLAARMVHNLASVAVAALAREPELASPHG